MGLSICSVRLPKRLPKIIRHYALSRQTDPIFESNRIYIMTFAFLTDIHLKEEFPQSLGINTEERFQIILKDIQDRNIDTLVFGGDLGTDDSLPHYLDSTAFIKHHFITLGNHDHWSNFKDQITLESIHPTNSLDYSFEKDQTKWIFLDSSLESISQQQLDWLNSELDTHLPIFLFIHHPILNCGTYMDIHHALDNRKSIETALIKTNTPVHIFSGHYHFSKSLAHQNIQQHIGIAASYQLEENPSKVITDAKSFGYSIVSWESENIEVKTILL